MAMIERTRDMMSSPSPAGASKVASGDCQNFDFLIVSVVMLAGRSKVRAPLTMETYGPFAETGRRETPRGAASRQTA